MSLRYRLWLSFAPLLLLLAALGTGAVYSLGLVGGRIDEILRANYRSVIAMHGLDEAIGRIDSSFAESLAERPEARPHYDAAWAEYARHNEVERHNLTEPGEAELFARLDGLARGYRESGDRFFKLAGVPARRAEYYGEGDRPGPLLEMFTKIKGATAAIRRLNQGSMERASANARSTAARARLWAAGGLAAALAATGLLAWRSTRTLVKPLEDLSRSARAVGEGRFDQIVSVETRDEVGELAASFNRMTAQLSDLRDSDAARLLRARLASQSAIDAFPDPILMIAPDGRVEMANPASRRVLGVEATSLHAAPWRPPSPLVRPLEEAIRDQRAFLTRSFDHAVIYRSDGEDRVYIPQVLPVRDPYGGTLGATVVLNDVTQFRLLDEFKSDLVATASHELKTPLAGLQLAVHLLLEEVVGPLTDKQAELLIDARENTDRLIRIVDQLLSLARLEDHRAPLDLRPEDPIELLRAASERVGPMAGDLRVEVDAGTAPLPRIAADAQRLGQALDNLLINAAAYTPAGGKVTLSARTLEGGMVELAVRDTGIGIPPEHLPHIFDKFFRVPGRSRERGTGLGLAIVREIALAHGGAASCESKPEEGSTFRLTLPRWDRRRSEKEVA